MSELIFLVEEAPEGGFVARALGEAIFTEADSAEELVAQVHDAVCCHFESTLPKLIHLHSESEALQEVLADAEDLLELRRAVAEEADAETVSLEDVKKQLGIS